MERILTLNVGATRLVLAEFEVAAGKTPSLRRYAFGEMPGGLEVGPMLSVTIEQTIREMLASSGIRPGHVNISLSGQMAFPRFVKIPADSPDRMREMIQFEVEQNVPFPLSEAVWSDAKIGEPDFAGEQHVMIVAARTEIVDAISLGLINAGCEPEIVDVAPIALYNAVRFNYPEEDGCTLVVDIGARSTNLVFVEPGRIFYRTIPVAGNSITAEIAKTFGFDNETAEQFKCERGLVAQGGAFAVDDPEVDRLSKVIRNVMARLNAEVTRSVAFYRSQQEGQAPTRVLLTGASSQLPYLQNFFEEKMQIEVDFLNPFQAVAYPKDVDAEVFGVDAFSLAIPVGLALRRGLTCPVEVNLVSKELVARKVFRKRIPFFIISAIGMIGVALLWFFHFDIIAKHYEAEQPNVDSCQEIHDNLQSMYDAQNNKRQAETKRMQAYVDLLQQRGKWQDYVIAVTQALPEGYWLTSFEPYREKGAEANAPYTGLQLVVSVWSEKEKGGTGDAIFAERLKQSPLFDKEKDGIKAISHKRDDWHAEYTIIAKFAGVEKAPAKKRR